MDKDDPNKGGPNDLFEDEGAFEEAPEGAALPHEDDDAGEWHDQPVDDLAESGEAYVEEIVTPGEENPAEDEFSQSTGEEPDPSLAPEDADQFQQNNAGPAKQGGLMKYLPFAGVGAVLLVLGFFGFQQISNMMNSGQEAMLAPPALVTANAEPSPGENVPPPAPSVVPPPPSPASASPPVGATSTSGEYILNSGTAPPPAVVPAPPSLPVGQLAPPGTAANMERIEQQLSDLGRQMEDMKRNQERIDEQLRNMQNAPPPPSLPDQSAQSSVRALEEKFTQLEQRVANAPPPPALETKKSESGVGEVDKPAAPKPKKKSTRKKSASSGGQWQQPGSYRAMPWILRSAQPGTAWLSQGMTSELQRVVPGDKLPGLGTIVSVRMVAGRWLVEGTQGSVR